MITTCTVETHAYATAPCLPHTGLDLWPIAACGVALLVAGLAVFAYLRRAR